MTQKKRVAMYKSWGTPSAAATAATALTRRGDMSSITEKLGSTHPLSESGLHCCASASNSNAPLHTGGHYSRLALRYIAGCFVICEAGAAYNVRPPARHRYHSLVAGASRTHARVTDALSLKVQDDTGTKAVPIPQPTRDRHHTGTAHELRVLRG